jgi:hypothetical protein
MFAGFVTITVITIVAVAGIAAANFAQAGFVLANVDSLGVPRPWLPRLAALKAAGAAGLLLGLLGAWPLGGAAAAGLVLFFTRSHRCPHPRTQVPQHRLPRNKLGASSRIRNPRGRRPLTVASGTQSSTRNRLDRGARQRCNARLGWLRAGYARSDQPERACLTARLPGASCTASRMTYDLCRLRPNGLIRRIEHTSPTC